MQNLQTNIDGWQSWIGEDIQIWHENKFFQLGCPAWVKLIAVSMPLLLVEKYDGKQYWINSSELTSIELED